MTTEQEYWDAAAVDPDVANKYIANISTEACLEQILPYLKPYSILEIGAGIGRLTTPIAERKPNCQVHGIDISTKMLDQAPPSTVKYRVNNGRRIPYSDESFDSVYSMLVFQHIPNTAKMLYIEEAYRVLKDGGVFRVQYVLGDHRSDFDHNVGEEQMVQWLKDAGFKIASISTGEIFPEWGWITAKKGSLYE